MKRIVGGMLAVGVLVACAISAYAAPPTVSPSPGYDARLQEQRSGTVVVQQPVAPVVAPAPPRHAKKKPAN